MCIIFIIQNQHPNFPIIIAANRDEYYSRPTVSAHFWPKHPDLLAGMDKLAGGTWLGVTRQGRFAAVTNYREPDPQPGQYSRGQLVTRFLLSHDSNTTYTQKLQETSSLYAGFNCIYGTLTSTGQLQYFSNRSLQTTTLGSGIYGLSNAQLDSPWPKITQGKSEIDYLLAKTFAAEDWLDFLGNNHITNDSELPDTGIGIDKERLLSSRFIQTENYGTRCSTIITVSKTGVLDFTERNYQQNGANTRHFSFEIIR